jgi:hypothetical protein
MSTKRQKPLRGYAVCVHTDDPDLLTPRMIYRILPDASAARSDYVRVVDNEGEDYLYPAKYFIHVDLPLTVKRALSRPPTLAVRAAHAARKG